MDVHRLQKAISDDDFACCFKCDIRYIFSLFAKFSKSIIDGATQAKDFNIVIKFALCMLFLVAFQMILNITKNSLSERCSARLEMILKNIFSI